MTEIAGIMALLDKHAPTPGRVLKIGLSPQRVRELLNVADRVPEKPMPPDLARLVLARRWPKLAHGSRSIPSYVISAMRADYERLGSLQKTGELYGRDASTMQFIFRRHGVPMKKRGGVNRQLPPGLVAAMAADYQRLGSLIKVGALYQRHATTIRKILVCRGFILKPVGCPKKPSPA